MIHWLLSIPERHTMRKIAITMVILAIAGILLPSPKLKASIPPELYSKFEKLVDGAVIDFADTSRLSEASTLLEKTKIAEEEIKKFREFLEERGYIAPKKVTKKTETIASDIPWMEEEPETVKEPEKQEPEMPALEGEEQLETKKEEPALEPTEKLPPLEEIIPEKKETKPEPEADFEEFDAEAPAEDESIEEKKPVELSVLPGLGEKLSDDTESTESDEVTSEEEGEDLFEGAEEETKEEETEEPEKEEGSEEDKGPLPGLPGPPEL